MAEEFTPSYTFTDDRLNELKQIFPEAFEDGVFNVDTLKELIGEFTTDNSVKEHFGLNWVGKKDARKIAAAPPTGTLKPCLGEGINEENTENIFIEGENLEVLKILRKSYTNKIKMIYIDPPYNTGTDFIYKDSFADNTEDYLRKSGEMSDEGLLVSNPKSSGKYHANWLKFMYPRLRLAKDLLTEEGSIFVSIGVQEISNLKSIMDEVFGEENFVEIFSWVKTSTPPALSTKSRKTNEYILCYEKQKGGFKYNGTPLDGGDQPLLNSGNSKRILTFPKDKLLFKFNGVPFSGELYENQGDRVKLKNNILVIDGFATSDISLEGEFKWDEKFLENEIEANTTFIIKSDKLSIRFIREGEGFKRPTNFIKDKFTTPLINKPENEVGTNENASAEIEELFGKKVFDFPKPISLIKYLINFNTEQGDIVLDFFAGSNTTASAVLYNSSEGNKLKFITIQIPEEIINSDDTSKNAIDYLESKKLKLNISELSKERVRLTLDKLKIADGFKVFKQSSSTIYKWQEFIPEKDGGINDLFSKLELQYKNPLQDGVTTQDFITEVTLQEGFPLTSRQEEILGGVFKITHEWVPYTLYVSMLYNFKDTDFSKLQLNETDHFVCLDKAFAGNDALKQEIDNKCKLYTI
ncbi:MULTISPECIES: site-specific DNA-methyltransferase [Chryseobacterium]|uniref:site-specific DNA-methyltransferase (adenine-specific) n=1 Tax=Chryseobacterium geocarposphaerae TaxID=1416776 RepID=A0ABU1LGS3_9FLAO|nr:MULTISPECIES: site-specific DNA-methyltransferase [Chryseobacterium]MDR6405889.1 adenine-specific DNA-methyltransferase [Chryseobacterium geocarposphaerae]MDR6698947.1 adenine-specific DNA-methyltransferase [Chryseobacterium ginsenosidimutans]